MGVGGVFLKNLIFVEEEEDDYGGWGEEGYEESIHSTYGSVSAAPTVNSQGVFSAPEPAKIVPPVSQPPAAAPPVAAAPVAEVAPVVEAPVAQAPPIPAEGLPEGWSMEQWNAYGQMWLEQNGRV
jgi:hypothetical protein